MDDDTFLGLGWWELVGFIIIVFIFAVSVLIITQSNQSKGFQKTFLLTDLSSLTHSVIALGEGGRVIVRYDGFEKSNILVEYEYDRIRATENTTSIISPFVKKWVLGTAWNTELIGDKNLVMDWELISPTQANNYAPRFFIALKDRGFMVGSEELSVAEPDEEMNA